jgi:hypothetical protein
MKLTPVMVVEEIEKSLPFWVDRMGFAKTAEVPEGDRLGFVILARDGAELMLQSLASSEKDEPQFAGINRTALFIEVEDFDDIRKRLDDYPIVMKERNTFYGMREIGVFEPNGNTVVFAARLPS